ncbi:hypothetical protein NGA_0190001 [Nannochloropsis gaditana CCMP526]|nr:hypothetical protein NGA_0190001 [Nannochloropsis gaditana CCMP526]EKU22077.1 hypothetical protein NGA_0190001 [Nannochloropsis gaditana CCMP526]|eukprot:XP_005854286.1 hypothetical protein NGA_0190001 [Nannochloropsis gaditana CCMP526]
MSPAGPLGALLGVTGILYAGYNSFYTVEGGHRALLFNRLIGVKEEVYMEGMHFMIPWFDMPIIYDIRPKPRMIQSLTGSKDMQMVNITIRVLSKPDSAQLRWIFRTLGRDYDERVLPSIVNEVSKAVVAKYNAAELLTKREMVSTQIRLQLEKRAKEFRIVLDDVSITHLTFSREYTNAVEAKQVAQQEAERAKYVVMKANQEKEAIIIKAEGEAQSAALVGKAIRENPAFIKLRKIDAARDIANVVSSSGQKVYLSADSLLLNMYSGDEEKSGKKR